ncbi:hypothetical protein NBT05_00295 [Aquimarina sp. ERC-38]|uniref:hypothetical protein n=1 Tax=Aquimarina sp. ERC-38 TaxID=2949996 RepID=UPI0022475153|nr:hypothetical protein [Aquimarina sp. ERC-38]UZO80940.1 hypothetical protein NBT05_00295 [Aquimarina sp. ERC-38]
MKIMEKFYAIMVLVMSFIAIRCTENPIEDFTSDDRQFLNFTIPGQVGAANIISQGESEGKIIVNAVLNNIDINAVQPSFQISELATVQPEAGEVISFSSDFMFDFKVVSESGKSRTWTVEVRPYESQLDGNWKTQNILFDWHIGIGETWGWGVFGPNYDPVTDTYPPEDYAPAVLSGDFPATVPDTDNTISFTTTGINEAGNPEGTFTVTAGKDREFGSYIFEPDYKGGSTDYSARYKKIPHENGVWEFNEGANLLTLQAGNEFGETSVGELTTNADGSISLRFENFVNEYTWDHFEAEAQIINGFNLYINLEPQE